MALEAVEYQAGAGRFTGFLADGSAGRPAPGVLVAHEGGGLTGHARERAERLASLGYVAFALDLFGDPDLGLEAKMALVRALRADTAELRARTGAALDVLRSMPQVDPKRLAAIGFCFGGTAVIELARTGAPLAAVVGFHAGLVTGAPQDNRAIVGRLLLCLGADDPVVTADQRAAFAAEMSEAGVDWQIHLYGGVGHSFTNPEIDAWGFDGFRYHPGADARSWAAMRQLFAETIGNGDG
ncbi:MAG: dienelactone hydrolase family protein [Alphaproteobacteria bacterium]|nr:dienelactone hydrolase family protein [Alphaproteobacteria bacterium]MBV9371682.1 dienelactone hydrolase family protein [Alphaproteobacteria bacterium]MBV9902458.1 dienelactone hydrolase family protein [Alphaproteobacteria bacterium]